VPRFISTCASSLAVVGLPAQFHKKRKSTCRFAGCVLLFGSPLQTRRSVCCGGGAVVREGTWFEGSFLVAGVGRLGLQVLRLGG